MPRMSRTRIAMVTLPLGVVLATPGLAQSTLPAGGGVQTTSKQTPADKQMAERVYAQLNADQVDYYKHVTVEAENGVVTLGGSVDTTEALNKAKKIAGSVAGVTKVKDQMTVERSPSRPAPGH